MQARLTALAAIVFAACSSEPATDYGGQPFWEPLDIEGGAEGGHTAAPIPEADRRAPSAISFADVTDRAGLSSAVGAGNTHGVGVAFVDLDGDEWPDIFVANGRIVREGRAFPCHLYKNNADGTFTDRSEASGIAAILSGRDTYSVAAADYDGDGDVDLYVGAQPTDVLLQNRGDGTFEDATARAGAGGPESNPRLVGDGKSKVVAFGDMDGDGDYDLISSSSTLPEPFAYLLENNGDGTFSDVSEQWNVRADSSGNPCAVMWSDYDSEGDADLWIWNDRGGHILLRNDRGSFTDATEISRADEVTIRHPMGIDGADIDHDGDLDYYVSNIGNNPLLRNNGDGTFDDITGDAGTEGDFGWGLSFQDFDLDGWPDLFVAQEDELPYLVFRNLGRSPPQFERIEVPHRPIIDSGDAHNVAAAFADYDRDGLTDVLVAGTDDARIILYRNETNRGTHRELHIRLDRDTAHAQGGIGARIGVKTGDLIQFRDVIGGSSRASQNELSVHFGLGNWDGVEWAGVLWPNGDQRVVRGVQAGELAIDR